MNISPRFGFSLLAIAFVPPRVIAADPPPFPVQVAAVTLATSPHTQPVAGTVRPFAHAVIAARLMGTVATADLALGRTVAAGEVLVTLDAPEYAARRAQAQAVLAQAEREFERETATAAQGASTADAVRGADDRRRQARAAAQEADVLLGYTRIAAPFAGVVTADFVKPGDLGIPGRALFAIEGVDHLRAEVEVPESLPLPVLGSPLGVVADSLVLTGTLAELSPSADSTTRTRRAKIDLPPNVAVRSGQFVRALWPAPALPTLTVPIAAVSTLGQMERVFVVTNQHAQLRLVKTGARMDGRIEITSGLDAGETVIVAPSAALRDGQSVTPEP